MNFALWNGYASGHGLTRFFPIRIELYRVLVGNLWLNVIKQNLQKNACVAQIESCLGYKNVVTVLNIYNILLKSDICVYEEAESWQPNNL